APFSGKAAVRVDEPAVNDEPAADAGAEDGSEDDAMTAPCADSGFRDGKAVGIVGDHHRQLKRFAQIILYAAAVQAGNVGADGSPRIRVDDAGKRNCNGL